jgi:hypothetical protein
MASFKFNLKRESDYSRLGEIQGRLNDFSPAFNHIVDEWAAGNALKFAAGVGGEMFGAAGKDLSPAVWEPVTEAYYQQKHGPIHRGERELFPDSLMVRTGALRDALCSRGGFAEYIAEHSLAFGTPMNEEEAMKAIGNHDSRPTVFLSGPDRNMIRRNLQQYLNLGADYKNIMMAKSDSAYALKKEAMQMDMGFSEAMANG